MDFLNWFISLDEGLVFGVGGVLLVALYIYLCVAVFRFVKKNKGKKIKDIEW